MLIQDLFPSRYITAADLKGVECEVTIKGLAIEDLAEDGAAADRKGVVYFEGVRQGLVLNKTNANTIAAEFGPETDAWVGRLVVLYPTTTEFRGEMKPCVRVRIPAQPVTPAPPAPEPTDSKPPPITPAAPTNPLLG